MGDERKVKKGCYDEGTGDFNVYGYNVRVMQYDAFSDACRKDSAYSAGFTRVIYGMDGIKCLL